MRRGGAAAVGALLLATLVAAGCGRYGPPVRTRDLPPEERPGAGERSERDAEAPAPAPDDEEGER